MSQQPEMEYEGSGGQRTPGQGFNQNRGSSGNKVARPTLKENVLLDELEDNLGQTVKFMKDFEKDKATLATTYEDCQTLVEDQFQKLRDLLNAREKLLLEQLKQRFEARDNKLQDQIEMLDDHKHNGENCDDECMDLIGTKTDLDERTERYKEIQTKINEFLMESPDIQQVPIDLAYTFATEEQCKKLITEYGLLKFRDIKRGRPISYQINNFVVNSKRERLGSKGLKNNNNSNIKVPDLDRFTIKFDRTSNKLSCEIKIKDAASFTEEKQNDAHLFLQIQRIGNYNKGKDSINWDECDSDCEDYFEVSKMGSDGKKHSTVFASNNNYEPGMTIHGRGRLVYLESPTDKDSILKSGEWSKENTTSYSLSDGSKVLVGEEDSKLAEIQDAPTISNSVDLPEKIKLKCKVFYNNGDESKKTITFQKSSNKYNFNYLLEKLQSDGKVTKHLKSKTDGAGTGAPEFDIVLANCGNVEISNDSELYEHVFAKAVNFDGGDLKETLGMQATLRE